MGCPLGGVSGPGRGAEIDLAATILPFAGKASVMGDGSNQPSRKGRLRAQARRTSLSPAEITFQFPSRAYLS
jgi:hypothetical protein